MAGLGSEALLQTRKLQHREGNQGPGATQPGFTPRPVPSASQFFLLPWLPGCFPWAEPCFLENTLPRAEALAQMGAFCWSPESSPGVATPERETKGRATVSRALAQVHRDEGLTHTQAEDLVHQDPSRSWFIEKTDVKAT